MFAGSKSLLVIVPVIKSHLVPYFMYFVFPEGQKSWNLSKKSATLTHFLQFHSKSPGAVWTGRSCRALSHRDMWPLWSAVVFANAVFVTLFPTTFETVSWKVHKLLCLCRFPTTIISIVLMVASMWWEWAPQHTYLPPPPRSINHMKFMWRLSIISASFSHLIDTSSTLHFLLGYLVVSYLSIVSKQIFHHWQHVVCFWQHRVQLENENEKHVQITSVPWWEEEHQRGQRQKGWGRGYRDRERNEERWEEALNQRWNHQVQLYYIYNTHITLWHIFDIYIYI